MYVCVRELKVTTLGGIIAHTASFLFKENSGNVEMYLGSLFTFQYFQFL